MSFDRPIEPQGAGQKVSLTWCFVGAPPGIRTQNLRIKSRLQPVSARTIHDPKLVDLMDETFQDL